MGGSHSVESITENINRVISDTIINSMQNVSSTTIQNQNITIKCDDKYYQAVQDCIRIRLDAWEKLPGTKTNKDIIDATTAFTKQCNDSFKCGINHVTMNGIISLQLDSTQTSTVASEVVKDISNKIESKASQETGVFEFGNAVKTDIKNTTESISKTVIDIQNNFIQSAEQRQTISVEGGGIIEYVDVSAANTQMLKIIQNNSVIQKDVQQLSNDLKAEADQKSGGIIKILITIVAVILIFLAVLGGILWYFKKKRTGAAKKESTTSAPESITTPEMEAPVSSFGYKMCSKYKMCK